MASDHSSTDSGSAWDSMYKLRVGSASICAATLGPDRSASTNTVGAIRPNPAARVNATVVRPGLPGPLAIAMMVNEADGASGVGGVALTALAAVARDDGAGRSRQIVARSV